MKKEFILGKYLPKILAIDRVLIIYFVIAIIFGLGYYVIDFYLASVNDIQQMTIKDGHPFDYIYFSLITQLTIGYGDIIPKFAVVRFMTTMQGVTGTILIGGIIASIIQYSSLLKIKKVYISKKHDHQLGEVLVYQMSLELNPTTVYTEIEVRIFCLYNNKVINIARGSKQKLTKSKIMVAEGLNDDISDGILTINDNRIYYESFNIYENEGNVIEVDVNFALEELIIELTYSIGTNTYTHKVKTNNLESFLKMIEGKSNRAVIDTKSLIELESY